MAWAAAIGIGLLLGIVAILLARESKGLLIGTALERARAGRRLGG